MRHRRSFLPIPAVHVLLLLCVSSPTAKAQVACENGNHAYCEKLLYKGSQCREDGFCSNPFEKGCLHTLLNHEETTSDEDLSPLARRLKSPQHGLRACNSEDSLPEAVEQGICVDYAGRESVGNMYADYTEVRILSQNWESAFFGSWIMQILLSELLRVPTTVETGTPDANVNFYSPTNAFGYGVYNDFDALARANDLPGADCRLLHAEESEDSSTANATDYKSCGHVIPEFWMGGDIQDLFAKQRKGLVDTPDALGAIGQQGIFVTKFTAVQDPTVLNLLGIAGEANRRKLAETFWRPTTWKDYCEQVSPTNCTVPDDVAQNPPPTEEDYERIFAAGSYTGHFRATEENDCDKHPTNCTGHVADFPCGWISFLKPQMYYHNIALASSGKEPHSHGYTYSQMVEMYAAANATRSNLMTMWWTPEATYSTYVGTDAEMQRVVLPTPTQQCVDHRILSTQRCEFEDPMEQYGDPAGACDEAPQLLQKVVASGLYKATYQSGINEAKRSPAYDAIKAVKMTELQLGMILQKWIERSIDTYGFDPRLATCVWVRENLDLMQDFIPRTHPRVGHTQDLFTSPLFYVAMAFAGFSTLMTIIIAILTYRRRNGYVMRFSQVEFIFLLLVGILLVSTGSVLMAIEPTNASCIANTWLLALGYTMEIVPLIVKVGAMNRLMTAAKRMKRIVLTRQQLFGTVALFVSIIVVFLILWTALDPPQRQGEFHLTDDTNDFGESIVTINYYCKSNSDIWRYAAVVWHCLLLLCATVLAFQTRNLQAGFSETSVLAIVIYSHFVFVVFRLLSFILEGLVSESFMAGLRSLVYSTDAMVTLCVYFIPKLLTDDQKFFNLTHRSKSTFSGIERGSVVTMSGVGQQATRTRGSNRSNISGLQTSNRSGLQGSNLSNRSGPWNNQEDAGNRSGTSAMIKPLQPAAGCALGSPTKKPVDVLKDGKVSWGGGCMSIIINDRHNTYDQHDTYDDEDGDSEVDDVVEETAPFERPVDVLKDAKDSWGGGHITMFIHDDDDDDDDDGDHASGDEEAPNPGQRGNTTSAKGRNNTTMPSIAEASVCDTKKSFLPPSNLPKQAPNRFNYAASRITNMREKHISEIDDVSSSQDE